jgi:hypothetical protein
MTMIAYFPSIILEEENINMIEEVSKEELQLVLHSFQKYKIQGPDGWLVPFFLGFYEMLEEYSLRVIEESKVSGRILATFNTTFISLIPKYDNPSRFEEFITISLCNCIYTIVSKIIARRMKDPLSNAKTISLQQFRFLVGR